MNGVEGLHAHLASGLTTVARAWLLVRKDGQRLGFTDHDLPLTFEGTEFEANGGLTAGALMQTSGLAIDNTEALGALSDARITEDDINAGLYDAAEVTAWLVNWTDVAQRKILFKGHIGEMRRADGHFEAELRGLTEVLNQPQGRSYLKTCSAILGDKACKVNALDPAFAVEASLVELRDRKTLVVEGLGAFAPRWFERGLVEVTSGVAEGLKAVTRSDTAEAGRRVIGLWEPIRAELAIGDRLRLVAGCDKRSDTCQAKFNNIANFQGFPFIPGDDWMTASPRSSAKNNGGRIV